MGIQARTLKVSSSVRAQLQKRIRSQRTRNSFARRARIILLLADGMSPKAVSETVGVSDPMVYKWRLRFEEAGIEGLADRPRSGQPRKLTEATVTEVLEMTVKRIPREATHWSTRLMAKYAGISQWQVRQIWDAANLKPHRIQTFKISDDPDFAEKVIDVVGLYMDPPDNAMVLSVDEKTQIQALDRTQPMLPIKPGQVERRTHDYKRHGTASLYAAFDIATGEVMGRITKRHRAKEFLDFLKQIDRATPGDQDLHLILDNSSTHKTAEIRDWLAQHERFTLHFTPTSASWLNAVESWFSQLERRALSRGVFTSVGELRDEIRRFIKAHNQENAKPFRWKKSAAAVIAAVNSARKNRNAVA